MGEIEEKIYCNKIGLKVINPDAVRNLDCKDKAKFNKFMVINNIKKRKFIVKLLWKGLIDNQMCLGCELLQDWDKGTNGEFNGEKLFNCKENRGILIPLNEDVDCCESINGSDHKLLRSNEIFTEDQICCVETKDKNELPDHKIYRTNIFGKAIVKKDVKWTGLVNGKECIGVNCNNKNYQVKYQRNEIIDVCKLSKLALIQMNEMKEIEEKLFCEVIELKVFNPDAIRKVDRKDQTKFKKFIIISNNKKKKSTVKLLWKGLIDSQICLGCELLQDWDYGTDGEFNGDKLFDCRRRRGILIPLNEDVDCCESINGSDHKSLKSNEIITEDQICCVESKDKNKLSDQKICKTNIFGKAIKKKDVEWTGLVNGKECIGVICNNKNYQVKYQIIQIFDVLSLSKLYLIQMNDIHIEFIDHIYVANTNDVSNLQIVKTHDNYEINQLVQVQNFYGKVEFFVDQFELAGLILDDEQFHKNHEFLKNILFKDQILHRPDQFILVKIEAVQNFIGEFHFKNDSCLIDANSIKYKSQSRSTKFQINEIVKSNKNESKYFKIQNFWNLNGVQCLSVMKTLSLDDNVECEYLRDIDACAVGEIKREYHMDTFIKPISIVIFEKSPHDDLKTNDDVEFKSRISDELFQGTIKMIVKANGILSAIVELSDEIEHDLVHCTINANEELFNLLGVEYAQYCIVPVDILRTFQARETELINQYFLDLFKCSNNVDLEIRIVQDIVQMNSKRFIKYIIGCKDRPLKLDVHQYLLPLLIEKENIQLINLLLNHCDLTPISSETILNLAKLALKIDDENLFKCAIENCKDKNALLVNGETFLTNLFKTKYPEELINKIILKGIFDPQKVNRNDESPFILACKMTMASIVEKIIPKTLSSNDKQIALKLIFEAEEKLVKSGQPLCDAWTIRNLIINTETRETMECNICMDKEKNMVLECGHLFCDVCTKKFHKCPSCDKDIGNVRKIYLS